MTVVAFSSQVRFLLQGQRQYNSHCCRSTYPDRNEHAIRDACETPPIIIVITPAHTSIDPPRQPITHGTMLSPPMFSWCSDFSLNTLVQTGGRSYSARRYLPVQQPYSIFGCLGFRSHPSTGHSFIGFKSRKMAPCSDRVAFGIQVHMLVTCPPSDVPRTRLSSPSK